jgi:radical SAM superfamily enzyme YgiQ (UPF0313 family)
MRYKGPIYRPPSEADSLLIQATVGCPHNKCTFCMVYKNGPRFKIRTVTEIKEDLVTARNTYGDCIRTLFFPAGNTIAMPTDKLAAVCRAARDIFPRLERITVYGSSQYIHRKGPKELNILAEAGLNRIHVGLESGDDTVLKRICKGTTRDQQIEAGQWVMASGMQLSLYVILGIGSAERTREHALGTAEALNAIDPHFIRLRTFLPKINTPMLEDIREGRFRILGPHGVLEETALLIKHLNVSSFIASDHYTNYINLEGRLPSAKKRLLASIAATLEKDESAFRPVYVGTS